MRESPRNSIKREEGNSTAQKIKNISKIQNNTDVSSFDKKKHREEKIKKLKRRIIHLINAVEHIKIMLFKHFLHSFSFPIPFETKAKCEKRNKQQPPPQQMSPGSFKQLLYNEL